MCKISRKNESQNVASSMCNKARKWVASSILQPEAFLSHAFYLISERILSNERALTTTTLSLLK